MIQDQEALLERERELSAIAGAAAAAVRGHGSLTVVAGPAGIGKTALLLEGRRLAERDGLRVLAAAAAVLEGDFAYGVVRQLLEPAVAAASAEERERLFSAAAQPAARVIGSPVPDAPAVPGQDASFGILHGLYWLTANLAESALMLWVDDIQWSDRASLRFLVHLVRRLEELPVAVVVSLRTGEAGVPEDLLRELLASPGARTVEPQPLSEQAVESLVRRVVRVEDVMGVSAACHRLTGGNPLYLKQVLLAVAEGGISSPGELERLRPRQIGSYVVERVRRIGVRAERLAAAMALLGRGPLGRAAALAGLTPAEAEDVAAALVAADILRSADPFAFVHPVVRAAVEAETPSEERDTLHLEAARRLSEGGAPIAEVAAHIHLVHPAGRDWCVEALRAAARESVSRGAPRAAVHDLRRALAEPPPAELRATVLGELGVAEEHAGDAAAVTHLKAALDATREQPARADAAMRRGVALLALFRFEEGLKVLRAAVEELGPEYPERALLIDARLISAAMAEPRYGYLAADRLGRVEADVGDDGEALGFMLAARAMQALMDNRREDAIALAHEALAEIARFRMPPSVQQQAIALIFFPFLIGEEFATVEPLVEFASAAAQAGGLTFDLFVGHALRSLVAERLGRLAEGEVHARAALEVVRGHDIMGASGWAVAPLVEVLVQKGELEEAERALALIPKELVESVEGRAYLIPARGRLRHAQRRHDEALADLLRTRYEYEPEVPGAFQVREVGSAHWRSSAALVLDEMGRRDEARQLADEELERAREFGAPRQLAIALRAAGLVERGPGGISLLEEAVAALAESPAELERGKANIALGMLLRRENRRAEAREPLRVGLDLAARCGARPLAELARAELVAAGGRPRRERSSGPAALTSAELRVAQLAANGVANKEIAQQLFLSLKTVEMHLNRAYRKLGIASRRELDGALDVQ